MKICVCIKQVPRRDWQPVLNEDGTWIKEDVSTYEMNEPDAYALEAGLRLRERHGGEVVVCSAGPTRASSILREALARGADRALHVCDERLSLADAAATVNALAAVTGTEGFDLVLTGLQSDDQGNGQVGVMLAEVLGFQHSTIVMEIQIAANGALRVKRELENGMFRWIDMRLPAVLTIQSGINELRYATLKGIMAAKKKEMRTVPLPGEFQPMVDIVRMAVPVREKRAEMISGQTGQIARTLVQRLREKAGVL